MQEGINNSAWVNNLALEMRPQVRQARFELYETSRQVRLVAFKTSVEASESSSLAVFAFGVLETGGVGDRWVTGGINSSLTTACSSTAPSACEGTTCTKVWLESGDCSLLGSSHVNVTMQRLSPALATLSITASTRGLQERTYPFGIHVPVSNGTAWQFTSISGTLRVRAVADATLSEFRMVLSFGDNLTTDVNHYEELQVQVVPVDVDGNRINRSGEQISIILRDSVGMNRTFALQFDASTRKYAANFTALDTRGRPGMHVAYLAVESEAEPGVARRVAWKLSYEVVCAAGHLHDQDLGGCHPDENRTYTIVALTLSALLVPILLLLVCLVYKNKDKARLLVFSFARYELYLSAKLLWDLWDIVGDCISFATLRTSGHDDLFFAFAFFLVPAGIVSLVHMAAKLRLIVRRLLERHEQLAKANQSRRSLRGSGLVNRDFRWLADRFILQCKKQSNDELKRTNASALQEAYGYGLLAAIEDAPFCVVNTMLLYRTVHDRFDLRVGTGQRLCSPHYEANFMLVLAVLMTSVAALVYKVVHALALPQLWAEKALVQKEAARLAEKMNMFESLRSNGGLVAEGMPASDTNTRIDPIEPQVP